MAVRANFSGTQMPMAMAMAPGGYMMGLPSGGPAWTPPNNFGVTRARLTSGMKATPGSAITGGAKGKNPKRPGGRTNGVSKKRKVSR